jgi:hypothetical protein
MNAPSLRKATASSIPPAPMPVPELAAGVTVELLKRVWHATPANHRRLVTGPFDSKVLVARDGVAAYVRLIDLTLGEVEAVIGARAPKHFVRYYQQAARGVQSGIKVATFVNRSDAEAFAAGKVLHGRPAKVGDL